MTGLQKVKRYQRVGLVLCGMCLLAACASIIDEKTQVVSVETPFCQAAKCKLSNDEGDYYIKNTPDSVMINKSGGDLVMTCEKGDDKPLRFSNRPRTPACGAISCLAASSALRWTAVARVMITKRG